MADTPNTHNGKIGGLPAQMREELCRRMFDGERAPTLLPWLNGTPEAQKVCRDQYEGEPISPQNLSAWRNGGFMKWQKDQRRLERSRERCRFSKQMVEASGGNMAEGVLASLTGDLAEILEEIDDLREAGAEIDPKLLASAGKVLVAIRGKEIDSRRLSLDERAADQRDRALDLDEARHNFRVAEVYLDKLDDKKAREIAESGKPREAKIADLVKHWFGEMPEGIGPQTATVPAAA